MAINSVLKRVLEEDVVETPSKDNTITLWEKNQDVDMEVEVTELSAPVTAIRMDRFSHLSVLRERGDLKKRCDYLLVVESADEIHAVFIELKKSLAKKKQASEQLRRSPPFLAYLLSVCKIEKSNIDTTRLNTNYFILVQKRQKNIDKGSVRIDNNKIIEKEKYKEIEIATSVNSSFKLDELTNPK